MIAYAGKQHLQMSSAAFLCFKTTIQDTRWFHLDSQMLDYRVAICINCGEALQARDFSVSFYSIYDMAKQ